MSKISVAVAVAILCGSGVPALAQATEPPGAAAQPSPAMAEAEANRARVKTPPRVKAQVDPEFPEGERALGHAGWVTVRGIVGVDGRMTNAAVVRSNAGPVLDAAALKAAGATLFTPAMDAEGKPLSLAIAYRIEFKAEALSPVYVKRVEADYPESERQAGHMGKVVVTGKIGPDGRLTEVQVKQSSRAPGLDAAALAAATASTFRPYRDGAGSFIASPVEIPFSFDSFHSAGKGGGILRYRCDQFVLDETWWRGAWPEDPSSELHTMILGVATIARGPLDAKTLKTAISDLDKHWAAAVEACRSHPEAMMVDMLKPEGAWAKRLAQP